MFAFLGWLVVLLVGLLMVAWGVFATWFSSMWSPRNDKLLIVSAIGGLVVWYACANAPFTFTVEMR